MHMTIAFQTSRSWISYLSDQGALKTNLQVANEFVHVASRRLPKLPQTTLFAMADNILSCGSTSVSVDIHMLARKVRDRTGYAWWDCLLLASALDLGCGYFLSEDLQDGQIIEGLTIVDPFAHSPEQVLNSG